MKLDGASELQKEHEKENFSPAEWTKLKLNLFYQSNYRSGSFIFLCRSSKGEEDFPAKETETTRIKST